MADYLCYMKQADDERPLYIFDKHFAAKAPALGADYRLEPALSETEAGVGKSKRKKAKLLGLAAAKTKSGEGNGDTPGTARVEKRREINESF